MTSYGAIDSLSIQRGLELAKEDLAKKGIDVEIKYQDDQTDPKNTVTSVQYMLNTFKPDVIIGPVWSYLIDSVVPQYQESDVLVFLPSVSTELVNGNSENVFFGHTRFENKMISTVKWLKENSKKKMAIVSTVGVWGDVHVDMYRKSIEEVGGEALLIESIPFGSEKDSIPTVLTKIKNLEEVDVIAWVGSDDSAVAILNGMQKLGLDLPIIGTDRLEVVINNELVSSDQDIYVHSPKIISEKFIKKFEDKYGEKPAYRYSDISYDGLMLIVEAIQNKKDSQNMAEYLTNKTNYKGYFGNYNFDENGDVRGGEWILKKI